MVSRIFQRLRHFKIYRKMLLSYFIIVMLSVLAVCITLFLLFSKSSASEISANSLQTQKQTSASADILYDQVQNMSAELVSNQDVLNFLYLHEPNVVIKYKAMVFANSLKASYPYIHSIGLYNGTFGDFLNPYGLTKETIIALRQKIYMGFTPRKCVLPNYPKPYYLLSFIMYPNVQLSKPVCAIIINVNESYMRSLIKDISSDSNSTTFICDVKGMIISDSDSSKFMTSVAEQKYIQSMLTSGKASDSFNAEVDGVQSLVTYSKSDSFGWYFVRVQPYSMLLGNIYALRNITLLIAVTLILGGLAFSLTMTSTLYNPINRLLEKVSKNPGEPAESTRLDEYAMLDEAFTQSSQMTTRLYSTLTNSKKVITERFLLNLLKGSPSELDIPEDIQNEINEKLHGANYCVLLLKIDLWDEFRKKPHREQSILRFGICSLAHSLLEKLYPNDTMAAEEDEILALLRLDEDELDEALLLLLPELQQQILYQCNCSVSIGIGDVAHSVFDIPNSYQSSQEYIRYRLFYSHSCIIFRQMISNRLNSTAKFPTCCEKKIIEAIKLHNENGIRAGVLEFIQQLSGMSYYQAVNFSNQLMLSLVRHFENTTDLLDENIRDCYGVIGRIDQAETLQNVEGILNSACFGICQLIDEKNRTMSEQKNARLIEEAETFILNNYQNSYLSIDIVAESVKLSCSYFGKLFKSISGTSYNEYLNSVRLEKARKLLSETDEPALNICKTVGFNNVAYFSTIYKKKYGVPPALHREHMTIKNIK